ncbi:uncharacterized protein LOC135101057 [Scylla paramamosain]|uniref:uncharacterized protein LOC135101057 n=1 Tax=Scylla paramamosain TaxID=85552 RepID=UPI00308316CA
MTAEIPLTETLEGLAEASLKPADNVEQLKTLVSRLHSRIKAQGVENRQEVVSLMATSQHQGVEHLVRVMEWSCAWRSFTNAWLSTQLRSFSAPSRPCPPMVWESLTCASTQPTRSWQKPMLAVRARLVGGVKLTHQLLQAHSKNSVPLLPLLMVA